MFRMNEAQEAFHSDVNEISPTLADWVEEKLVAGFSLQEVKRYIIEAAKVCGKE